MGVPAALSPGERGASTCRKETLQSVLEVSVVCGGPPTDTRGNWGTVESTHQESPVRVPALPCPGQTGHLTTGPGSAAMNAILASNQDQRDKGESPLGSRPRWRVHSDTSRKDTTLLLPGPCVWAGGGAGSNSPTPGPGRAPLGACASTLSLLQPWAKCELWMNPKNRGRGGGGGVTCQNSVTRCCARKSRKHRALKGAAWYPNPGSG